MFLEVNDFLRIRHARLETDLNRTVAGNTASPRSHRSARHQSVPVPR